MADKLEVIIEERESGRLKMLAQFLDRETRDDFFEESSEDNTAAYRNFDELEFPEEMEIHSDFILVYWEEQFEVEVDVIESLIQATNCRLVAAHTCPDHAIAGGIDDINGYFYARVEDKLVPVDSDEFKNSPDANLADQLDFEKVEESLLLLARKSTK